MLNIDFERELLKLKVITESQLQQAKANVKNHNGRLASAIVRMGFCAEKEMALHLSTIYKIKTANIKKMQLNAELTKIISETFCKQYFIVPLVKSPTALVLAVCDPLVFYVQEQLERLISSKIEFIISTEEDITMAMETFFPTPMAMASGSEVTSPAIQSSVSESNSVDLTSLYSSKANVIVAPTPNLRAVPATTNETPPAPSMAVKTAPMAAPTMKSPPPLNPRPAAAAPAAPLLTLKGDVLQMVNTIISEAIKRKSSDIHIEQYEKKYRVRYRIDGNMQEVFQPVTGASTELVSRIKVMSKLDVSEKRRPQDGRTKFQVGADKFIDLRVNVLPTLFGEKVVMRILDKSNLEMGINSLGFSDFQSMQVNRALQLPQGMILVTGPTGSGKTTTLYSALHALNDITCNISTSEDPVEFYIDGINQVQINNDIGFTFADALRAFLRQDPDVIMVGEIRDAETANVAYKAASTGHLVLSTLHTNDAISTVFRLIDMGVPKYVVAEGTSLIVAQRLIKKICKSCVTTESIAEEFLLEMGVPKSQLFDFHSTQVGAGCAECNGTGLKGRVAIHEVLEINSVIRKAISTGMSAQEVRDLAIKNGMTTLRGRAIELLKMGVVSYHEVVSGTISDDNIL